MSDAGVFAGRYRLESVLGAGAFGVVHAAFDEGLLQRRVAIKLLSGAAEGRQPTEEQAERFIAELRLAGALRHPHIATVYDAGVWQGQLYMVVELIDGVDLGRFMAEHAPLPVELALSLAAQMLDAVASAHEQGVVHRDLKPGNLMVDRENRAVVVDFGLATSSATATQGQVAGTPGYAAPEQLRGGGDARADQFSLGAVLYLMLTGTAPFLGRNQPETLRRTLMFTPEPPSAKRPELPAGLDRVVMRALSRDPAERYADLRQMSAELLQYRAYGALPSPDELRARLVAAAARGALVVLAEDPRPWMAGLRLALGLSLLEAPDSEGLRLVSDPRQEIYPTPDAPVLLALEDEGLDLLGEADDGLRAAILGCTLLIVDWSPELLSCKRLLNTLRTWGPGELHAVASRWRLDALRAAERRGLQLLEQSPTELLPWLVAELPPAPKQAPRPLPGRPYKFLSYFDATDEQIFFGRDTEIARMCARILARPVTLLYGASGAGKTSLVRAALVPRLGRAGHRVLLARVFDDPLAEICRAAGLPFEPNTDRASLLAAQASGGAGLLIVFLDQLEELFVRFSRPGREAVAAELTRALDASEGRLRLVLSLRADYLARLVELKGALPLSLEAGLYLESLSASAARDAVTGPAALHGVTVEPALLDRIIEDLSTEGIDPPSLQLVCDALWEARDPSQTTLTLRDYAVLGEARSILARHLSAALGGLAELEQPLARALLKAMVTTADTRSVRRLDELARAAGLPVESARTHCNRLAGLRLIRPLDREDGVWYELTHEVLAAEIGRWLTEADRRASQVRELLEQGTRAYDQLGLLLSPAQLRLVEPLERQLSLSEAERTLLHRSRAAEYQRRRRQWALAAVIVLAAAVSVVGARALWLSSQSFALAPESRLSWSRWGEAIDQTVSPVTVYRGAADPWWLDQILGYPRDPYQTDWVLQDMSPELQDTLRAGVDLPEPDAAAAWLRARLGPVAAARERFLAGDLAKLDQTLRALAQDPGIGSAEILALAPVLALGQPDGCAALPALLDVAVQRTAAIHVPTGNLRLEGQVGQPMGLLLYRTPPARWRPLLDALLETETGPELVGDLMAVVGSPQDLGGLGQSLGAARSANVEAAAVAIAAAGDCAHLDGLRAVRRRGSTAAAQDDIRRAYLQLARDCGGPADLQILDQMFQEVLQGELDFGATPEILRALYRLDPAHAAEQLARSERSQLLIREGSSTPWGLMGDARMVAALQPGSPQHLHARLYLGDPSAVWPALDYTLEDRSNPSRLAFLAPLAAYRGGALQRRAQALIGESLPVYLRLPLISVAAGGGDAAAAEALDAVLASDDIVPLVAALNHLSTSRVSSDSLASGRQVALARALVALRRGEPARGIFLPVLADPEASYLELWLAVEGQRRIWATGDGAVAGLRSPVARVRLAATLALATRAELPVLDDGGDPWLAAAISRARWAHHALAVDQALRADIRANMDAGALRHAQQLVRLLRSPDGPMGTLNAVLAPQLPGVRPAEIEDEAVYLQTVTEANLGLGSAFEWMSLYVPPAMWPRYATEPLLGAYRDRYVVAALSGLRAPLIVEDP